MQMTPFFNMINIATGTSTADKIQEDEVKCQFHILRELYLKARPINNYKNS